MLLALYKAAPLCVKLWVKLPEHLNLDYERNVRLT